MGFEDYVDEPYMIDNKFVARSGINYTNLFYYETKFFNPRYVESKKDWMQNNWQLSFVYAAIYIVAVFAGKYYMRDRPKYDLRRGLIAWNVVLAGFSIMGSIRVWPEFIHVIRTKGFEHSFCNDDYTHGVNGCWGWLFLLSKVPELVDTLFIVMRKQQLIFLHWYHHCTVLVYCWYSCKDFTASGRWFVLMNFSVHAVMYSYYALRALRFRIPKWVNIVITSGQISQMIIGIIINTLAYRKKARGDECHIRDENIKWSFLMYFSYFLLFFNFFYKAYISKPKAKLSVDQNGHAGSNGIANGVSNGHVNQHDKNNNNVHHKSNGFTKKTD